MAENIQKTQNAQPYFSHNSAQTVFFVRKICKRLRCFLHKKSRIIWFISIFVLILHPDKEIDFQKRSNHNYIKTQTAETFKNFKGLDAMSGLFVYFFSSKVFSYHLFFLVFVSFSLVFTKMNAFWTKSTPLFPRNSLSLHAVLLHAAGMEQECRLYCCNITEKIIIST